MHCSKKLQACIEALVIIGLSGGSKPVNSKELCRLQGEKARYLESIMQCLVHGNILRSVRGPKGGYVLMRDRRKITLGEIAMLIHKSSPEEQPETALSSLKKHIIHPLCAAVSEVGITYLNQVTLEDLCKQVENQEALSKKNGDDFII